MAAARARTVRSRLLPHQVPPGDQDWALWLLFGGRGIGKTYTMVRWLVKQALKYPGTSWRAVGRTWPEARDILAEGPSGVRQTVEELGLEDLLDGGSWDKAFTASPGNMKVKFRNRSIIRFGSAEQPKSLRGGNYHGAIADELAFWDPEAYSNLRFAVRLPLPDGTPARIVAATTPNGQNWFFHQFIESAPLPRVKFIGGADLPPDRPPSTYDNQFLDEGFVELVAGMYEGTDLGAQEIYGGFLDARGAIYRLSEATARRPDYEWPLPTHWVEDAASPEGGYWSQNWDEVIAGQDLGSEHPSAFVVLARRGDTWHVVAEVIEPAATEDDWFDMIAPVVELWQPDVIYSDHNFPQTLAAQQRRGLPVVPADKSAGSVLDGIRIVQAKLAGGHLLIDQEACPKLWRQLIGYRWKTGRDGAPLNPERPVKKDDDGPDALRYALFMVDDTRYTPVWFGGVD